MEKMNKLELNKKIRTPFIFTVTISKMDLPAITSESTWVTQLLLPFDSLVCIYVSLSQLHVTELFPLSI